MPKKSKKGGSSTNYNISPCNNPENKSSVPKIGLNGGSHQMYSDTPSEKELASCFKCESGTQKYSEDVLGVMVGGGKSLARIEASRGKTNYLIDIIGGKSYKLVKMNLSNGKKSNKNCKNIRELRNEINKFNINEYKFL